MIDITINDKEGYITISSSMSEPYVAAQVGQRVLELLQKYVTEFKIEKATAQYNFIKGRYDEAKADYETKQLAYARFQDANRSLTTALSQTKATQIRNEYDLANTLFAELSKQLVQAEIKVKEDTPVFTIVEPIQIPVEKSKPKRLSIIVIWTFLGYVRMRNGTWL